MFKNFTNRITYSNSKLLRNYLKEELKNYWVNIINTNIKDYYWNKNLLSPNPMKEKNDNGDIDLFLYLDNQWNNYNKSVNVIKDFFENSKNIKEITELWWKPYNSNLKYVKNWLIYSFMYKFKDWVYQVDLHLIPNTPKYINNYFEYFRVDYFFFILWMALNRLNVKLGINWVYYRLKVAWYTDELILITNNIYDFLYEIFWLKKEVIQTINSFNLIWKTFNSIELSNYDFFHNKEALRNHYEKKIWKNDKLKMIIDLIYTNKDTNKLKPYKKYKPIFKNKLFKKYSYLTNKINNRINELKRNKELKEKHIKDLKYIYWYEDLWSMPIEQKRTIPIFNKILDELVLLKTINNKLKKINKNYNIYLVWWTVRDLLLGENKINDIDITWNIPSDVFSKIIWWTETEKLWTVFYKINDIEIEYTPFRREWNYNGRKPQFVDFNNVSIKEDCNRRDFTINSLYLDINTLQIIDITWKGIEDINKKIVRAVWNPENRFNEDYLRILRWIRLSSKTNWTIEINTKKNMKKYFYKLNNLSKERIIEEIFKWLKYKNYLLNLNYFTSEKLWFIDKNIINVYKKFKWTKENNFFVFIYSILGWEYISKLPNSQSKKDLEKKIFYYNKIQKININIFDDKYRNNIKKLHLILYDLFYNSKYTNKEIIEIVKSIWNIAFINWKIIKKTLNEFKKNINKLKDKNISLYDLRLKKWDNFIKDEINKNNLIGEQIKQYFKKEILF